jgi:hypothetical protein
VLLEPRLRARTISILRHRNSLLPSSISLKTGAAKDLASIHANKFEERHHGQRHIKLNPSDDGSTTIGMLVFPMAGGTEAECIWPAQDEIIAPNLVPMVRRPVPETPFTSYAGDGGGERSLSAVEERSSRVAKAGFDFAFRNPSKALHRAIGSDAG